MTRGEGGLKAGDSVTNGAWVGTVLAEHGRYVWVLPLRKAHEDAPRLFGDGPLTFQQDTLDRTGAAA